MSDIQLVEIIEPEDPLGCSFDAVYIVTVRSVSKRNLVKIGRNDFLFGQKTLQPQRQQDFFYFAVLCAVQVQKYTSCQLLGECTASCLNGFIKQLLFDGTQSAAEIDSFVVIEIIVLYSENGIDH
ncbi:hypothetical protein D3C75_983430 [compost metagenome]